LTKVETFLYITISQSKLKSKSSTLDPTGATTVSNSNPTTASRAPSRWNYLLEVVHSTGMGTEDKKATCKEKPKTQALSN
jgi:hypothetical protein